MYSLQESEKMGEGIGTVKERKFRIPSLLVKLVRSTPDSENLLSDWQKRFPNM